VTQRGPSTRIGSQGPKSGIVYLIPVSLLSKLKDSSMFKYTWVDRRLHLGKVESTPAPVTRALFPVSYHIPRALVICPSSFVVLIAIKLGTSVPSMIGSLTDKIRTLETLAAPTTQSLENIPYSRNDAHFLLPYTDRPGGRSITTQQNPSSITLFLLCCCFASILIWSKMPLWISTSETTPQGLLKLQGLRQ
jgi:hypothetical protein